MARARGDTARSSKRAAAGRASDKIEAHTTATIAARRAASAPATADCAPCAASAASALATTAGARCAVHPIDAKQRRTVILLAAQPCRDDDGHRGLALARRFAIAHEQVDDVRPRRHELGGIVAAIPAARRTIVDERIAFEAA